MIDTGTSTPAGPPVTLSGFITGSAPTLANGGSRVIAMSQDSTGNTTVTVLDTATGAKVGTPQTFAADSSPQEGIGVQYSIDARGRWSSPVGPFRSPVTTRPG